VSAIPKLPNFFIVGAPKAGTTSLYAYLDQHPEVYMCPLKEPSYFAFELRPENFSAQMRPRVAREMRALAEYLQGDMREKRFGGLVADWEDYLRLYGNVSAEIAIGEATATYLWSPTAARNIAARVPHARIIINLRNPVDRAYSQYLQMLSAGVIRSSFREQIYASLHCKEKQFGSLWPLLEYGQYCEQIKRYLNEFPRAQIHVSYYEDLERAPGRLVADLFAFLGVDPGFVPDLSRRHHQAVIPKLNVAAYYLKKWGAWPYLRKLAPVPLGPRLRSLLLRSRTSLGVQPADRAFLTDYYRDDIEKLATLLDRDLTAWLA
jgi:Sulfotransferase family